MNLKRRSQTYLTQNHSTGVSTGKKDNLDKKVRSALEQETYFEI